MKKSDTPTHSTLQSSKWAKNGKINVINNVGPRPSGYTITSKVKN